MFLNSRSLEQCFTDAEPGNFFEAEWIAGNAAPPEFDPLVADPPFRVEAAGERRSPPEDDLSLATDALRSANDLLHAGPERAANGAAAASRGLGAHLAQAYRHACRIDRKSARNSLLSLIADACADGVRSGMDVGTCAALLETMGRACPDCEPVRIRLQGAARPRQPQAAQKRARPAEQEEPSTRGLSALDFPTLGFPAFGFPAFGLPPFAPPAFAFPVFPFAPCPVMPPPAWIGWPPPPALPALTESELPPLLAKLLKDPRLLQTATVAERVEAFPLIDEHFALLQPEAASTLLDWMRSQMPEIQACLEGMGSAEPQSLDAAQMNVLDCALTHLSLVKDEAMPRFLCAIARACQSAELSHRDKVCKRLIGIVSSMPPRLRNEVMPQLLEPLLDLADRTVFSRSTLPLDRYRTLARIDMSPQLRFRVVAHAARQAGTASGPLETLDCRSIERGNRDEIARLSLEVDPHGTSHSAIDPAFAYGGWLAQLRDAYRSPQAPQLAGTQPAEARAAPPKTRRKSDVPRS
ncbi:MAG TPA: hypothetical protein VHA82_07675 [Ramlibacter sp.]|uniref:hypothetical protein n=1 Tax=Ramlibacter sp. TaxID=1917967 RepID=UPI002B8DA75D|nr:hypothetical protein [Ramlibacter sp.]HVZ43675.1 hypothetical protein [Ramlibacter sp.]